MIVNLLHKGLKGLTDLRGLNKNAVQTFQTSQTSQTFFLFLLCCCLSAILSSCGVKEKLYTPTEAEQKLVEFCKKEGQIDVTTRQVGRTQWVYLGLEEPIFDIKAGAGDNKNVQKKAKPWDILSLDGAFKDRRFAIVFDIIQDVLPPDPVNYGSTFNESYGRKRQIIYQGIQESFFNLTKDEETKKAAPIFFVITVADIKKGIAVENTFYLDDLKAYMTEAIPFEEYYMREHNEVIGNEMLIGDKTGKNLTYYEVQWPDFLIDQTKARIQFKFAGSDFPPKGDADQEIISIVANTLRFYPFKDFDSVYLHNRRDKREMSFHKEQLATYEEAPEWEKKKSRMHVIKFNLPNPPGVDKPAEPVKEEESARKIPVE